MEGEPDREQLIASWAERIEGSGLTLIALPLLEVARALGFLGSQALLLAQPLLSIAVDDRTVERYAALLDDPELLDGLMARLEGRED